MDLEIWPYVRRPIVEDRAIPADDWKRLGDMITSGRA
jgi:hypothetical protein